MSPASKDVVLSSPFAHQREFLADPSRFKVGDFGRQSGKTESAGHALVEGHGGLGYDGLPKFQGVLHGKQGIWFAPTDDLADVAWRRIKEWFKPVWADLRKADSKSDKWIEFPGGGRLAMKSGWNPETSGIAETVDFVILDEAARCKARLWELVQPMLSVRNTQRLAHTRSGGGWAILISTPRGKNWFWREWIRGQKYETDGQGRTVLDEQRLPRLNEHYSPEHRSWIWPSNASPLFGQAEFESFKRRWRDLPTRFEQEILARFVVSEGNYFKRAWFQTAPRIEGEVFLTASLPLSEESRGELDDEESQRHMVIGTWVANRFRGSMLVDVLKERCSPAEIPAKLAAIARAVRPRALVVGHAEPIVSMLKASGEELPNMDLYAVYDSPSVSTDESERVAPAATAILGGRMRFLEGAKWFEDFQAELFMFPDPEQERSCVEVVALAGRMVA